MGDHAILSPSSASRWLACPPSARLEQQFPDRAGDAAAEGTLAHKIGELLIEDKAGLISKPIYDKKLKELQASEAWKKFYSNEMFNHAEDYAIFVMESYAAGIVRTKDAKLFIERKIDLTKYVPESWGTGDACVVADHYLDFTDLKYGKGVEVSAERNRQMMLYALGLLDSFDFLFDIERVRMTIFQPRMNNISAWEISVNELTEWAETELRPKAKLAFAGEGEFLAGKHCQFCRVKGSCKAYADEQLKLANYDFKAQLLLEDFEVSDILKRAADFKSWLKGVEDFALSQAVTNGKKWPGLKLVEGRSNRKYSDEETVATKLIMAGIPEDKIYEPKTLLGITAMEKSITKKVFNAELEDLIIKPPGKPALVSVEDKRPELNSLEKATLDFAEEIDD